MKKQIDLAVLDTVAGSNAGCDIHLKHPVTGDDLGVVIHVLGRDGDEFRKKMREQQKKRLDRVQRYGMKAGVSSIEDMDTDGIELLAAMTKSWTGMIDNGKEIICNQANAAEVYTRFPWIREQVDAAIGDRANFIKG